MLTTTFDGFSEGTKTLTEIDSEIVKAIVAIATKFISKRILLSNIKDISILVAI
jgi:hypothetical protein